MPTTTRGYRYPAGPAAPNVPLDLQNLASDVDSDVADVAAATNIICTSGTRPSSPVEGTEIYETDTNRKYRYDGSNWQMWPPQVSEVTESTVQTTTSATLTAGTANCETTFTAPPTGRVMITVTGDLEGIVGTANGEVVLTYEIRNTNVAGAIFLAGAKAYGLMNQGEGNIIASRTRLVTGFTAGSTYYIRTLHASGTGGSTVTVNFRQLLIVPCPN